MYIYKHGCKSCCRYVASGVAEGDPVLATTEASAESPSFTPEAIASMPNATLEAAAGDSGATIAATAGLRPPAQQSLHRPGSKREWMSLRKRQAMQLQSLRAALPPPAQQGQEAQQTQALPR